MMTFTTLPCTVCGLTSEVDLDPAKFARWKGGEHVQNVWPEWSPDARELLITGTHPKCWDEIFNEGEKDNDENS